ncbi:endo-1,4-beta-xylanase [Candidatus Uhrbacteria bacterium]|nr:endo-1,4-beta-xylanase [Candidatus Uhrbacteria bacterium]
MHDPRRKKFFSLFLGSLFLLAVVFFTYTFLWIQTASDTEPVFGITYSWVYARQLGLDPRQTYHDLIEDLQVRSVRLPLYWSEIEPKQGEFDWTLPDEFIQFSQDYEIKLTVVIGAKVPRWPECFIPDWAEQLDPSQKRQALDSFLEKVVQRYKRFPTIIRWQIENEPFFPFGECPNLSQTEFQEHVNLVRSFDDRPIQVSVSGELGSWSEAARSADILGISLYRQTWNPFFGYIIYPLTPDYYFFRSHLIQKFVPQVIISELQAEPWFSDSIQSRSLTDWYKMFTVEMFEHNVQFARKTGLGEVYLWGAEWWYRLKESGDDRLWEAARSLF